MQFRVWVGKGSPLHGVLDALPAGERGAALVRLAEEGQGGEREARICAALERIARALEGRGGEIGRIAVAREERPREREGEGIDPRLAMLDAKYGDRD